MARKHVEDYLYKFLKDLTHDDYNSNYYKSKLASMSDKQLETYLKSLVAGEDKISITIHNFGKAKLTTENNLKLAKEMKVEIFKKMLVGNPYSEMVYETPNKFMIIDVPVRRVSQRQKKKISVAKDSNSVDMLTKQPSGDSASRSLSLIETQLLLAIGLPSTVKELGKVRGGDEGAYRAMLSLLNSQGGVKMSDLNQHSTGVSSKEYWSTLLKCQHIGSTL